MEIHLPGLWSRLVLDQGSEHPKIMLVFISSSLFECIHIHITKQVSLSVYIYQSVLLSQVVVRKENTFLTKKVATLLFFKEKKKQRERKTKIEIRKSLILKLKQIFLRTFFKTKMLKNTLSDNAGKSASASLANRVEGQSGVGPRSLAFIRASAASAARVIGELDVHESSQSPPNTSEA
jgi:hypothetical protein